MTIYPISLLRRTSGDMTFDQALVRLKCDACGSRPAPVYLCAGHRRHCGGAAPDWAVELVSDKAWDMLLARESADNSSGFQDKKNS